MWKAGRFRALTRWLKVGDWVLILCLISVAVVSGVMIKRVRGGAKYCIVSLNGKDKYKLLLSQSQTIRVNGPLGSSIIEIQHGGARMQYSPCPLKICMHQGMIRSSGEMIICIPNHVLIRITGPTEVDAITW